RLRERAGLFEEEHRAGQPLRLQHEARSSKRATAASREPVSKTVGNRGRFKAERKAKPNSRSISPFGVEASSSGRLSLRCRETAAARRGAKSHHVDWRGRRGVRASTRLHQQ